ncbi:MAG: SIMPL domain-containing protein [Methanolinea sp.]|nr:SIMPL domain-containing protein [Methanolinea sp.]
MEPKPRAMRVALAGLLVLLVGAVLAGTAAAQGGDEKTLATSGRAETMVTPDRAVVTVSVVTENADVKAAQGENARTMDGVKAAIEGLGIPRRDLKTVGYSVVPVYDDSKGLFRPKVKYYQVTNSLQVTLRDVTRTGEVIDAAVTAGANQVGSIGFFVSDELEQSVRNELLAQAVNRAYSEASAVANAAGVKITGVKQITVSGYYPPRIYASNIAMMRAETGLDGVPTPIEAGEVKVTAEVSVVYLIG